MTKNPIADIEAAISLREKHQKDWNRHVKLYMGERVNTIYKGDFNPFVMESHTIVESIVAHIAGGDAEIDFLPSNPEQKKDTKALSELVNYWLQQNDFEMLEQHAVRQSCLKGNAYWYAEWDPKKKMPVVRFVQVDDILIDPTSTGIKTANYIGHTYLTSKSELREAKAYDSEKDKLVNKYKNLRNIGNAETDKLNPYVKKKLEQSTLSPEQKQDQVVVSVLYYRDGSIVEVANCKTIIRDVVSPYQREEGSEKIIVNDPQQGQIEVERQVPGVELVIPYAEVRGFIDPNSPYSHGEMHLIADRQENLNELEAQDLDNTQYINNVMARIDPRYEHLIDSMKSGPGAWLALPRGAFEFLDRPAPNIDLDLKKNEIKDEMRRVTAADEIIQGVSTERSRVTATEIGSQIEQSAKRFQMRIDNLENEGFKQLATIMLRFAQLFVNEEMIVRVIGEDGVSFQSFDPRMFEGDFEPVVKLRTSVEAERKALDNRMMPAWEIFLSDPTVNRVEALRAFGEASGFKPSQINRILSGGQNAQGITGDPSQLQGQQGQLNGQGLNQVPGDIGIPL